MEFKAVLLAVALIVPVLCGQHAAAQLPVTATVTAASGVLDPNLEQKPMVEQLLARKQSLGEYLKGEAFQRYREKQLERFSQQGNQRGVLIVAGGRDMFANAAITVMMLRRHLRSSLPVEIVHFGDAELSKDLLPLLQELNSSSTNSSEAAAKGWASGPVYVTDAMQAAPLSLLAPPHRPLKEVKSFPAKVYALTYATRFQQVLLMDADSMPLIDPAVLFEVPAFKQHGDLFWSDFWWNAWVNGSIYTIMGGMQKPPWENKPSFRLVDSGQILFDRLRHAEVLEYLWLLNSHHEWVYKHMHGDKDTFLLAFAMAGRLGDFKQVPCFVRDALVDVPGHKHRYHHLGMVQSLPPGVLAAALARASRAGLASASSLLHSAANATAAAAGASVYAGSGGSLLLPRSELKGVAPGSLPYLNIGVPVVFHRTSFNSKFFPDCLDKKKIADKYCQVQYVTVPMSNERSGHSLKPNMYAFNEDQVATDFYERRCGARKPQPAAPAAAGHRRRSLLLQSQQGRLRRAQASSSSFNSSAPVAGQHAQAWLQQEQQQEHGWQLQVMQRLAQPLLVAVRPMLGAGQQLESAAGRRWRTLQQRAAAVRGLPDPAARDKKLLPSASLRQPEAAVVDVADTDGSSRSGGSSSSLGLTHRQHSRQQLAGVVEGGGGAAARRLASLQGVQLQRLALQQIGTPPEWQCASLQVGQSEMPIPAMKVEVFSHMHGVLQQSYEVFREVRERLKL
ncbi:mannosyltransferase putative-domain-containing protein [Scenedesmus sp. NREL 46B-D3]|nr:mannosyltransferase putative-domain-containing protein [Scenedesmus sp. NREL 46B-D3]